MLAEEDFWRGEGIDPWRGRIIQITMDLANFKDDPKLNTILQTYCPTDRPEVARLTYIYRPKGNIPPEQAGEESYEYEIYGGDDAVGNKVKKEMLWGNFSLQVIDALRDANANLTAGRLPLRRLLKLYEITPKAMEPVLEHIRKADQVLQTDVGGIKNLAVAIQKRLVAMTEQIHDLDPAIRFLSGNADSLIRALRILVEGGQPIDSTSLGLANVLYLTLSLLDVEEREKVDRPKRDEEYHFTILAIEEPEAHLHPHLQRILLRDFVNRNPLILSTHSPHIASICPLDSIVMLRKPGSQAGAEIRSTARLSYVLTQDQIKDLQRYLDVTRAEVLFARSVIFVEGDAEQFLLPELARQIGYDLDKHGVTICNVGGVDFLPYILLAGPYGLDIPHAVMTDGDIFARLGDAIAAGKNDGRFSQEEAEEISKLSPPEQRIRLEKAGIPFYLGLKRGIDLVRQTGDNLFADLLEVDFNCMEWKKVQKLLESRGIFVNTWSFEPELVDVGYASDLIGIMTELGLGPRVTVSLESILVGGFTDAADINYLCKKIEDAGKGRVAQRMGTILHEQPVGSKPIPEYIQSCLKYLIGELDTAGSPKASGA